MGRCLGEVIGTGFFGAIASYPLMKWFYGLDAGSPYYYIPFYTPSAVMGAAMGVAVLLILRRAWSIQPDAAGTEPIAETEPIADTELIKGEYNGKV